MTQNHPHKSPKRHIVRTTSTSDFVSHLIRLSFQNNGGDPLWQHAQRLSPGTTFELSTWVSLALITCSIAKTGRPRSRSPTPAKQAFRTSTSRSPSRESVTTL